MVDFASLNTATIDTVTRFHNFAKNIETAQLGAYYTTLIDTIDYYAIECVAKPALANAPEWVSDNRVVSSIQNNKGLTILAGSIITFIFIVIMLHPKVKPVKPPEPDLTKKTRLTGDDSDTNSDVDGQKKTTTTDVKTKETVSTKKEGDSDLKDTKNINSEDDGTGVFTLSEEEDLNKKETITVNPLDGTTGSAEIIEGNGTPTDPDNGVENIPDQKRRQRLKEKMTSFLYPITTEDNEVKGTPTSPTGLDNGVENIPDQKRRQRLKEKMTSFLYPITTEDNEVKGTPTSPSGLDNGVENTSLNDPNSRSRSSSAPLHTPQKRKARPITNLSPVTAAAEGTISETKEKEIT